MQRWIHTLPFLFFIFTCSFLYKVTLQPDCFLCFPVPFKWSVSAEDILRQGNAIVFLETSNRLELSSLVSCSVESASRTYPDRPVIFFMKGLGNNSIIQDKNSSHEAFSLLSAMKNVHIFPLHMETLLQDTPLLPWYFQAEPEKEHHWIHISSDACRLAIIWKYGGIYMDTDIISIQPISTENFLAAQSSKYFSSGSFGFQHHNQFVWNCMEDFVRNFNGKIWGQQGPGLFTRMIAKFCELPEFPKMEDKICNNISFLHPHRFYPIPYPAWKKYYQVWKNPPIFNESYALHLWNYMNSEGKSVESGSNTLVENLYKVHCPSTYEILIKSYGAKNGQKY
ncbi:alpha-1,4-N-acetylglucosaminyltransferase-like [Rhinatrema bivittatum]|uniref:alpha-1,4-N-acetylglucosaminyltransferase-like n=1 Tax=Rhinatrema bivittatum TaxID=194408 RepID=UPI00112E3F82|nr:alpha-1,4-N-acetylglucosaminyltransferase-like [Rhinatrema bivittatum]